MTDGKLWLIAPRQGRGMEREGDWGLTLQDDYLVYWDGESHTDGNNDIRSGIAIINPYKLKNISCGKIEEIAKNDNARIWVHFGQRNPENISLEDASSLNRLDDIRLKDILPEIDNKIAPYSVGGDKRFSCSVIEEVENAYRNRQDSSADFDCLMKKLDEAWAYARIMLANQFKMKVIEIYFPLYIDICGLVECINHNSRNISKYTSDVIAANGHFLFDVPGNVSRYVERLSEKPPTIDKSVHELSAGYCESFIDWFHSISDIEK